MSGPRFHWDEDKQRWIIYKPSDNPVYRVGYSNWVYEDRTMMKIIDQAVENSEHFPDAETIWQMMVDGNLE